MMPVQPNRDKSMVQGLTNPSRGQFGLNWVIHMEKTSGWRCYLMKRSGWWARDTRGEKRSLQSITVILFLAIVWQAPWNSDKSVKLTILSGNRLYTPMCIQPSSVRDNPDQNRCMGHSRISNATVGLPSVLAVFLAEKAISKLLGRDPKQRGGSLLTSRCLGEGKVAQVCNQ